MLKLRIERTKAMMPPPSRTLNARFEVWRDPDGEVYAYAEGLGDEYRMHVPGLASFRFSSCGDEIAAAVASTAKEELVLDAYRRRILPMALHVSGREVLHASGFRSPGGVVALCADSGTGKSTIAFGLSSRGYRLWADDLVAFETSDRGCLAISLPFKMRLRSSAAVLFGLGVNRLPAAASDDGVLRREDTSTTPVAVRPVPSAEALGAVLSHAWFFALQDGERKRRLIEHYLELVARIPVFDISFRSGLENLPTILDAIEQLVGESTQPT